MEKQQIQQKRKMEKQDSFETEEELEGSTKIVWDGNTINFTLFAITLASLF